MLKLWAKAMRFVIYLLMISLMTVACAALPSSERKVSLSFGCTDIVLIGKIKNGEIISISDKDDILGHGEVTGEILVRESVRGDRIPSRLPVKYFAHTYMREDIDFIFVLHRSDDGAYVVKHAQIMSVRPRLSGRCE